MHRYLELEIGERKVCQFVPNFCGDVFCVCTSSWPRHHTRPDLILFSKFACHCKLSVSKVNINNQETVNLQYILTTNHVDRHAAYKARCVYVTLFS